MRGPRHGTALAASTARRRRRALAAVPVAALVLAWGSHAGAQSPLGQTTPPTTANGLQQLVENLLGQGTVPPAPPPPAPAPPAAEPGGELPPGPGAEPGVVAAEGARVVPPEGQAAMDSIRRTPPRTTDALITALRQLVDIGLSAEEAAVLGMGHFPVAGPANYFHDFLYPRFNPEYRPHQGTDIFAAEGTPVRASEDGTVRFTEGGISGKAYYLYTGSGTYYFGCHLVAFADLPNGASVSQGQIVGYVGDTGDAAGGPPHLHFEIHPGGGAAVDPKGILDGWLDDALANVAALVASYQQTGLPKPISYAGTLRRFDEPLAGGHGISTLLAASSSNPGIRRLSELRASRNLTGDSAAVDAAIAEAWKEADQISRKLLTRLTPAALQIVLVHDST